MTLRDVFGGILTYLRSWLPESFQGGRTQAFIKGISKTFPCTVFAQVVAGATTLLAARALGPAQFGEANLSLASTLWVQIPLFIGLPTALMHYTPQVEGRERTELLTLGFGLSIIAAALTLGVSYGLHGVWASWQGISVRNFDLGLIWCMGFWINVMGTILLSSREKFGLRGLTEIVFALSFPLILILCARTHALRGEHYVFSLAMAFAVSGIFALGPSLKVMSRVPIRREPIALLVSYGLIATFAALANALLNSPARLIANQHMTLNEVGVLSVYQGGAGKISSLFLTVGAHVFFPIASRTPDKKALFWKIHRVMISTVVGFALFSWVLLWAYFKVAGGRYSIVWIDSGVYAFGGALTLFFGLMSWYLASTGRNGMLISVVNNVLAGGINFGLCWYLIPSMHILGAGIASAVACLVGMAVCYLPWVQKELAWLSNRPSINGSTRTS